MDTFPRSGGTIFADIKPLHSGHLYITDGPKEVQKKRYIMKENTNSPKGNERGWVIAFVIFSHRFRNCLLKYETLANFEIIEIFGRPITTLYCEHHFRARRDFSMNVTNNYVKSPFFCHHSTASTLQARLRSRITINWSLSELINGRIELAQRLF